MSMRLNNNETNQTQFNPHFCSGARVILGCRDVTRGEEAAKKIRRASGNGNVVFRQLDLASLESVRKFARETLAAEKDIHILLNNAGNKSILVMRFLLS